MKLTPSNWYNPVNVQYQIKSHISFLVTFPRTFYIWHSMYFSLSMSLQSIYFFMYHYQSAVVILSISKFCFVFSSSIIYWWLSVSQPVVCHNYYFFSSSHCCNLVSPFSLASSPGLQLFIIEGLGTRLHSHAKQAVKFIIIIIVWNVHDQVYIFMLVILMHSALCSIFHSTKLVSWYCKCMFVQ